jgi:hypothetical protein
LGTAKARKTALVCWGTSTKDLQSRAVAVYYWDPGSQNGKPGLSKRILSEGYLKNFNLILGLALLSSSIATASSVFTYTETVVGSGTFDATAFSRQTVTLTETADTSGIALFSPGVYILPGTVTVTVPGIGTGTFTDSMEVFSNQNASDGGFYDLTLPGNVLFNDNAAFATYDLSTPIGPLSGTSFVDTTDTFATTLGNFSFSFGASTATFTAVNSAAPEPGTMGLLGIGLAAAVLGRRLLAR